MNMKQPCELWGGIEAARQSDDETSSARASLAGVRMARYKMFFNPAKAIRELGLPQTPPRQALADAVAWFQQSGYGPR